MLKIDSWNYLPHLSGPSVVIKIKFNLMWWILKHMKLFATYIRAKCSWTTLWKQTVANYVWRAQSQYNLLKLYKGKYEEASSLSSTGPRIVSSWKLFPLNRCQEALKSSSLWPGCPGCPGWSSWSAPSPSTTGGLSSSSSSSPEQLFSIFFSSLDQCFSLYSLQTSTGITAK